MSVSFLSVFISDSLFLSLVLLCGAWLVATADAAAYCEMWCSNWRDHADKSTARSSASSAALDKHTCSGVRGGARGTFRPRHLGCARVGRSDAGSVGGRVCAGRTVTFGGPRRRAGAARLRQRTLRARFLFYKARSGNCL